MWWSKGNTPLDRAIQEKRRQETDWWPPGRDEDARKEREHEDWSARDGQRRRRELIAEHKCATCGAIPEFKTKTCTVPYYPQLNLDGRRSSYPEGTTKETTEYTVGTDQCKGCVKWFCSRHLAKGYCPSCQSDLIKQFGK